MALVVSVVVACFVFGLFYALALRPWFLYWGATLADRAKSLPGDALLPSANSTATRAITILASPERVRPWIVQLGHGRGGFYSYTWIENLFGCQIINAEAVHPEWQVLAPGDGVRLHPEMPALPVAIVDVPRGINH